MYTISRNTEITPEIVSKYIKKHRDSIARFDKLERYYKGEHDIINRTKSSSLAANNKLVCNHAKYITDTAAGYMAGNPITYQSKTGNDITVLKDWLERTDSNTQDMDLAHDASIFGVAYELVYMSDDENPTPRLDNLDPRNAFVVYDDTVQHKPIFGVYYYPVFDVDDKANGYRCYVYTATHKLVFLINNEFVQSGNVETELNPFCDVCITEIYNNSECQGDFEQQIPLIDAYNILQSDRVNDKEQFVSAILLLIGTVLGDSEKEESEAYRYIKEMGMITAPEGADAKWLTRTFDEASVELLRKSIENDIHKFSGVPAMNDENFAGNSSGVAMKYKLLGFEQITRIKERYFREGLRQRLKLFSNIMAAKGMQSLDLQDISIKFTRNLPVNDLEQAEIVSTLRDMVPDEILLSQLSFVDDPEEAVKKLREQKDAEIQYQQQVFGNNPLEVEDDEE